MQSEDKYIDNPDDFSKKIGEKLREHQLPVGSDVWESLSDRLPVQKRTLPLYLRWVTAGVAAVALLLFFLIEGGNEESERMEDPVRYADVDKTNKTNSIIAPEGGNESAAETPAPRGIPDQEIQRKKPSQEEITELAVIVNPEASLELENGINPEEAKEEEKAKEAGERSQTGNISKPEEAVQRKKELLPVDELLAENHLSTPDREHREHQSLMASLGSGGALSDFLIGNFDMDAPQYNDFEPGGNYGNGDGSFLGSKYNLLSPDDYTDVVHHLPVSFSLTANFPVGEHLGLETGLSYTYLFSRFSRNDKFVYRGTLQQHYIGIPVNLRYTVWQNDAWGIYLLGGGTIEKGLSAIYKQETEYRGSKIHYAHVYSRIDGFQFSAQGGAGFSYRLRDNLSLFGEPRIVYYYKNNQPMSSRTDSPLIFGLNLGIRIRFK